MYQNREGYNEPAYKAWRYAVFTRDRFKCALCPSNGGNLEAHHIIKWSVAPHLRYVPSNGITLCKSCHDNITNHEEEYEDQFKRIVGMRKIQTQKKTKGVGKNRVKKKYRLRNPRLRF